MKKVFFGLQILGGIILLCGIGYFIRWIALKIPFQSPPRYEICLENECYWVEEYKSSSGQNCVSFFNNKHWIALCGNIKIKKEP